MKSVLSKQLGVINANNFEQLFSTAISSSSNYYLVVGRAIQWANTSNTALLDDITVPTPIDSVNTKIDVMNNGIFLKRINSSDLHPVIPRIDWVDGNVYTAYDHEVDLFSRTLEARISSPGTANVSLSLANTVVANGINFNAANPSVQVGTIIRIGSESKEIVRINTAGDFVQVNTNFTSAYTSQNVFKVTTSTLTYPTNFYVRNSRDQIFKCMFNNANSVSSIMPETSIGGQLPGNPYITTSDGYRWKYMYTIPSGLKQRFFTASFMPVTSERVVTENAVDGRIDIVQILNGGSGYYGGLTISNYSPTSNIVSVIGDGTGAQLTVDVTNGVITKVNIVDGGEGYTYAEIKINDPLISLVNTAAVLRAVISPSGGHGSDNLSELGASFRMLSSEISGDVNGKLPVLNDGTSDFRQIGIVKDPKLLATGELANDTTGFNLCTQISVTNVTGSFTPDSIVYVGSSYEDSTFSARVVHYASGVLFLNNLRGDSSQAFLQNKTINQKDSINSGQIFVVTPSDINIKSGQLLYLENRARIIRNPDQIESTRILFAF